MSQDLLLFLAYAMTLAVMIDAIIAAVAILAIWKKNQPEPPPLVVPTGEAYQIPDDFALAEEESVEENVLAPLDIADPINHPPSWKEYNPRPGAAPRSCACHPDQILEPGDQVLWWPHQDGSVTLFCRRTVEELS